jgi:DNA-directed RNA polymerase specialized sigma24 family protein
MSKWSKIKIMWSNEAKQIIRLHDKDGLSFSQIGKILGRARTSVHRTYQRAKK